MMRGPREIFAHRQNQDGSWDSICRGCIRIVATRKNRKQLSESEKNHDCKLLQEAISREEIPTVLPMRN